MSIIPENWPADLMRSNDSILECWFIPNNVFLKSIHYIVNLSFQKTDLNNPLLSYKYFNNICEFYK